MPFNPENHLRNLETKPNKPPRMYLEVKWRLVWLREDKPLWGIRTACLHFDDKRATFQATIADEEGRVLAMAHGTETPGDFGDYFEKAETKSIGRALAMCGYGTQFTGSELDEGERLADSPTEAKGSPEPEWDGAAEPSIGQLIVLAKRAGMDLTSILRAKGKNAADLTGAERLTLGTWFKGKVAQ